MNVKKLILETLQKKGKITVRDIVKKTGFSRAYINRFFYELKEEGKIILIGGARRSKYVPADQKLITEAKKTLLSARRILTNKNLSEDSALDAIKKQTGIFWDMPKNVVEMLTYAFLEMLNNAIEHSKSQKIEIRIKREADIARFDVIDKGIGIFRNIMRKRRLENELEAIQDLLKGKQTTAPEKHTGEGIFFTSKIADMLIIQSSKKKLIFNNIINDIFIENIKNRSGTKVTFAISIGSKKQLADVRILPKNTNENVDFMINRAILSKER